MQEYRQWVELGIVVAAEMMFYKQMVSEKSYLIANETQTAAAGSKILVVAEVKMTQFLLRNKVQFMLEYIY